MSRRTLRSARSTTCVRPPAPRRKTRVGRGEGSKGKTAGRGTKGTEGPVPGSGRLRGRPDAAAHAAAQAQGLHQPRSGSSTRSSTWPGSAELFPEGGDVDVDDLVAKGAVRKNQLVKVLGTGDISVALNVDGARFSARAKEKIAAAGGSVSEL